MGKFCMEILSRGIASRPAATVVGQQPHDQPHNQPEQDEPEHAHPQPSERTPKWSSWRLRILKPPAGAQ